MPVTGDDALVGRLLDHRYLIGERIARGGMASVFLGTDQRLDRRVAIKVMHSGLGDDGTFTQRFEREARAAAKLNHRGVVAVFDQGHDGDVTYLVMEYVPGRTLRDVLREEAPMPARRALGLLADVLAALSVAHRENLVHRDVKPENVLITPDGEVKVADFGLSRAVSSATTATGGTLMGTVSYLAPEIVVNDGVDRRSDVYACGAMLFEMLTGEKPHTGDTPIHVAYKHVHEDIAAPSSVVEPLPDYVDALVARATARDRALRSADAGVLLHQVRMVIGALDAGLESDPDLVADLAPRPPLDPDEEATAPIPVGGVASAVAATGGDVEPTMHWSTQDWHDHEDGDPSIEDDHAEQPPTHEEYGQVAAVRRDARRGRALLIGIVVLAVVLAGLGYWLGVGRYAEAPQLVGRSEAQAIAEAEEAGFELTVGRRAFSETAPLGTVISTDPPAGDRILPGSTITAVVSKGVERYEVPSARGLTLEELERELEPLTLQVGEVTEVFDDDVEEGRIVRSTSHDAGDSVRRGTAIDVEISKGPEPIEIVDQSGRSREEAVEALRAAGFQVEVEEEFSDDVDRGDVISQDPDSGTGVRGDTITVVVSRGPEQVEVPDVRGESEERATQILEEAGFEVRVRNVLPGDTVLAQTPDAGDTQRFGSRVTIFV